MGRFQRFLIWPVALLVSLPLSLSVTSTAAAAGNASISFCAVNADRSAYANQPVILWSALPNQAFVRVKDGRTNARGCGTFGNQSSNRWVYVQAFRNIGKCGNPRLVQFNGRSGQVWAGNGTNVQVGSFWVYLYQLC